MCACSMDTRPGFSLLMESRKETNDERDRITDEAVLEVGAGVIAIRHMGATFAIGNEW